MCLCGEKLQFFLIQIKTYLASKIGPLVFTSCL
jgi:hypothetical protein